MGLFGGKKEIKKKAEPKAVKKPKALVAAPKTATARGVSASDVLVRPHITEKAAQATARGVYTFEVRADASKREIARAIQDIYRVKPVKIGLVKVPATRVRLRTRRGYGTKGGMKKAYVYLKKGDRIEFAS